VKRFTASDLEICELLAPYAFAREPWGYYCLPSSYFGLLLNRSIANTAMRVSELRGLPYHTKLSEQTKNLYRDLIFQIDRAGIEQLREVGYEVKLRSRPIPHELMACSIAASFELHPSRYRLAHSMKQQTQSNPARHRWGLKGRLRSIGSAMGLLTRYRLKLTKL
jgi:hypothetical protein